MSAVPRALNRGRQNRLLARLDKALAKLGIKPPKRPAKPAAGTVEHRARARERAQLSRRSYQELRQAIQASGGIRPNRDYPSREIPRELRAKPGRPGLAPDEMAQVLSARGLHYEGDVELFTDIHRRREAAQSARQAAARSRRKNPSLVCADMRRDARGRFVGKA